MNKNYTVEVHRKIQPVSFPYTLKTHLVDTIKQTLELEDVAKACLVYSRDANGSYIKPDTNLYFLIRGENNIPFVYGTPSKNSIIWKELGWVS